MTSITTEQKLSLKMNFQDPNVHVRDSRSLLLSLSLAIIFP